VVLCTPKSEPSEDGSEPLSAAELAAWAKDLRKLVERGSPQQRKALLRNLVQELKVMSGRRIEPTYKIPALVRAPEGQVEVRGVEPLTSAVRRQRSTTELHPRNTQIIS
jgi:hypothetical protein